MPVRIVYILMVFHIKLFFFKWYNLSLETMSSSSTMFSGGGGAIWVELIGVFLTKLNSVEIVL